MICKKCGKKIADNQLFCPECEAKQTIPEYNNNIEDELLDSMKKLKEETQNRKSSKRMQTRQVQGTESLKIPVQPPKEKISVNELHSQEDKEPKQEPVRALEPREKTRSSYKMDEEEDEDEDWEEYHLEKRETSKQKRIKLISAITALSIAIVAVLAGIISLTFLFFNNSSYQAQMEKGDSYWKKGDYESAITAFENAVSRSEDEQDRTNALCKLANLYVEYGDENSAIYYFEEAATLNKLSNEDVSVLVLLYENKSDITAIRKLAETYSNSDTESLFEKHLLNQPVFNYKSGTYNELLTVEITAANNESIFFTLDNEAATPQSTPYTGPLQIGEGTTIVRAVAVNSNGLLSNEIITTYEVKLDVPPTPVITPETGTYSETGKISLHNIPTNCKAYYTIDGTVPTAESMEYTEPFDMMLGNYVIMAVCINEYTGQSSPVAMKIYDLNVNGKISYAESPGRVMSRLQETGQVLDGDGTMANGEKCMLLPVTVNRIGKTDYYIVKRYQMTGAGIKEQGTAYAVDINTGAVFQATDNGAGQYNLSGL